MGTTRNPAGIPREACSDVDHERKITMKSRNRISMTVLILAVSAWVAPSALSESHEKQPRCTGEDKQAVAVVVPGWITVVPPTVELCPERTLTIHIAPPPKKVDTAETYPKPPNTGPAWLNAKNNPDPSVIVITVPADEAPGDYDYSFKIDEAILDPRVRVKK
jgi:hypothetical protein